MRGTPKKNTFCILCLIQIRSSNTKLEIPAWRTHYRMNSLNAHKNKHPFVIVKRWIPFLPMVWIGVFCILVLHTFLEVGHWPRYNSPDPKEIGCGIYNFVLYFGLFVIWITSIFSLLHDLIETVIYKDKRSVFNMLLIVVNNFILFLFIRLDFFDLMDWFLD